MVSGLVRTLVAGALLLSIGLSLGSRSASAADFAINEMVVVSTDALNLRTDAGTDGEVVMVLQDGARMLVKDGPRADDGYNWYKVILIGDSDETPITGWVASDFIASENGGGGDFVDAQWVEVSDGPLNVRSTASLTGSISSVVQTGFTATVVPDSDLVDAGGFTWINITTGGAVHGWVATDFLSILTSDPGDDSPATGFEDALGVAVIDGPVNVRRAPGLDQTIVTTLQTGSEVPVDGAAGTEIVTADGFEWVAVLVGNGIPGYIATDFLEPLDHSPNLGSDDTLSRLSDADAAVVTDGPLNLRAEPGTSGQILLTLEDGDYLWLAQPVTDYAETVEGHTWVLVDVAGETGWVAIGFISPAE
jgi:uncharacterized protein YgiM (DUF1202 family)